ncbi:MAG: RsmD family RNA methyltransferase, partial [Cyclobacteriaceae bacterium]|nr:RsmD family RNA methyltransferase [Cyclobacteriaceae bacterium]
MIDHLLKPEVQEFIKDHQTDDPFALSLKSKSRKDFPLKEAIEQIHSLQKAKLKIPGWVAVENIIWPQPVSIEQSSSEITALFKSELIYGKSIVDLTGGMGADTGYFAERFAETHYVESNPDLAAIARHNFDVLKKNNITVYNDDAEKFLNKCTIHFDAIFLDPSRRIQNKKVFKIEDCAPNLYEIVPKCLKLTNQLLIKLSPLVDLSLLIKDF